MSKLICLLVFCLASQSPADKPKAAPAQTEWEVPAGKAPALDGKLDAEEWKSAVVVASAGLGTPEEIKLLAQQHDGHLYLGLSTSRKGIATLGIAKDDKVQVLHASAALGAVDYLPDEKTWKRTKDFEYRCREDGDPKVTADERREHLQKYGWIATTIGMSKGQTEIDLGPSFIETAKDGTRSLRCAFTLSAGPAFRAPRELADGLTDTRLQFGTAPKELSFVTQGWLKLSWKPKEPTPK